ncbi:SGNH/GDSL hydrolase family protein [Segatella baroniae]|uniref:SGNH/GDSL hydrolase family protein n=1 Tax=Segatella baroniae TaxID=305719 RepID=UPI000488565A|nr:SGNH/GDSL hydrolase family protein [Segatella baroniae]
MRRWLLMGVCALALPLSAQEKQTVTLGRWVGTWATAPQPVVKSYMPYDNNMTNRSVRQIVKASIGGSVLRLKLSNLYGAAPVEIRSVYIALSKDSFELVPRTARYLQFGKQYKVVIPAGKSVESDPLNFELHGLERLTVTINYAKAPAVPTVHMGSRTTSYILPGVTNAESDFGKAFREEHWFNIAAIDVYDMKAGAIAILGNSITDGKNSNDNAQNRWPDMMSEALHLKHRITTLGVLNLGIGNNRVVLPGGFGTPGRDRFERDILGQSGVTHVVIFEGVNDIGAARGNSEQVAARLIAAYGQMIAKAKARGLKVFLATITPFEGAGYYSYFHEAARETVNEWIRGRRKDVDGIIDFAELMQDPANHHRLRKEYQSDWLHPNAEGYRAMGYYAAEEIARGEK